MKISGEPSLGEDSLLFSLLMSNVFSNVPSPGIIAFWINGSFSGSFWSPATDHHFLYILEKGVFWFFEFCKKIKINFGNSSFMRNFLFCFKFKIAEKFQIFDKGSGNDFEIEKSERPSESDSTTRGSKLFVPKKYWSGINFSSGKLTKADESRCQGSRINQQIPFPAQIHIIEISKWANHDHRIEI